MAARKKSTGDERVDAQVAAERLEVAHAARAEKAAQDAARERFGAKPTGADFMNAVGDGILSSETADAIMEAHGYDVPGMQPDPVQPTITKLQLHTRAHILGIQGTSDSLVVGDVIESIEPDMLGPIPGFVVRLKRGAPVFFPQASVLAVTVVS